MKEALQKLQTEARRSGLATDVQINPSAVDGEIDAIIILKDPDGLSPKKGQEPKHPINQVGELLGSVGIEARETRWFPAAKNAAVIVIGMTAAPGGSPSAGTEDRDKKTTEPKKEESGPDS